MASDIFDDIDDEILSNFPCEEEKLEKKENVDDDEDSADEILTMLMDKEKAASPPKKKIKKVKMELEDGDSNEKLDEETKAQIARLQAQIFQLKKAKNVDKNAQKNASNNNQLCKHSKQKNTCFFCSQNSPTSSDHLKEQNIHTKNEQQDAVIKKDSTLCFDKIKEEKNDNSKNEESLSFYSQKKPRLAHKTKVTGETCKQTTENMKLTKEEKLPTAKTKPENGKILTFAGLLVSNPLISSTWFEDRISGRKLVKISKIESTMQNNDIEGDWVTVGVIIKKVVQKTDAKGKNFSVWQLSDLGCGNENKTVGFFLFGDTYKEHWKMQVGTVIALLNPTIMKQEKSSSQQGLSVTLDNSKKLMEIGTSKELGVCKGIRKSDGKSCSMFINKTYGDYCEYHVQKAFKKAKAGRMELQSGSNGPDQKGKADRLKNVKKDIASGVYHYGGSTVTLNDYKKSNVKVSKKTNNVALKSIMGSELTALAAKDLQETKRKREKEKLLDGGSNEFKQLLDVPTVGSRNLIHMLHGNHDKEQQILKPKSECTKVKQFLNTNKKELFKTPNTSSKAHQDKNIKKRKLCDVDFFDNTEKTDASKASKTDNKRSEHTPLLGRGLSKSDPVLFDSPKNIIPMLGRGLSRNDGIEFSDEEDDDISYNLRAREEADNKTLPLQNKLGKKKFRNKESNESILKKQKAISILRSKGPISPEDPNQVGKTKSTNVLEKIEKQVQKCHEPELEEESESFKRKSLLAGVLGHIDINSEEGKKLLKKTSKNAGAIRLAEAEREEKYFESLGKKERMEEKMNSVYEIKVTCHACNICKYIAESASKLCKDQKHHVVVIPNVFKRFFMCKSCKCRTSVYKKPLPTKSCQKCGDNNYVKVAMTTERKGPKIGSETLELRGREQKFLNSTY